MSPVTSDIDNKSDSECDREGGCPQAQGRMNQKAGSEVGGAMIRRHGGETDSSASGKFHHGLDETPPAESRSRGWPPPTDSIPELRSLSRPRELPSHDPLPRSRSRTRLDIERRRRFVSARCVGQDLNLRTPTGQDSEPCAFDQAGPPTHTQREAIWWARNNLAVDTGRSAGLSGSRPSRGRHARKTRSAILPRVAPR